MSTAIFGDIKRMLKVEVVTQLPTIGKSNRLYFVLNGDTAEENRYDEYIWVVKESTSAFEKIGDTKIDTDALKSETLAQVSANYIKTVTVTPSTSTDDQGVTKTTYTFSFKNGEGAEISTASVVSGGGYALATAEKDGLMSKADKAKLDSYELVTDAEIEDLFKAVSEVPSV